MSPGSTRMGVCERSSVGERSGVNGRQLTNILTMECGVLSGANSVRVAQQAPLCRSFALRGNVDVAPPITPNTLAERL